MGSIFQMPYDGVLEVQHRRLRKKQGLEWMFSKVSGNAWDFDNGWITGKDDMSVFWRMGSYYSTSGLGIQRFESIEPDMSSVYAGTWCKHEAFQSEADYDPEGGTPPPVGAYEFIPALMPTEGHGRYIESPMYVPTTNELWYVSNSLGAVGESHFMTGLSISNKYAQIMRCNADQPVQNSVSVHSEFTNYYGSTFSGTAYDSVAYRLQYDHFRDCVWAYTRNNDVNDNTPPEWLGNVRNSGYLGLLKFSTSGVLLDTIKFIEWTDVGHSSGYTGPSPALPCLPTHFTIGHDGLFWYCQYQDFTQWTLNSYNPDTGVTTSHPGAWASTAPAFMPDGRLLLTRAASTYIEQWILYDPVSQTEELLVKPGGYNSATSNRFMAACWTSRDMTREFPGILVTENLDHYYQLMPGHFGLTVTSADFTRFDKPWTTTDTPIYDTEEDTIYTSTYGPFKVGDKIRFGLLLQREGGTTDAPAAIDLAISRKGNIRYVVDGENNDAYWEYDEETGIITIKWAGYPFETLGGIVRTAAETVVTLTSTEQEIVPGSRGGCPSRVQGLSLQDRSPFVGNSHLSGDKD